MDSEKVINSNAPATDKADFERQQPYDPHTLKRFGLWSKRTSSNLFGAIGKTMKDNEGGSGQSYEAGAKDGDRVRHMHPKK